MKSDYYERVQGQKIRIIDFLPPTPISPEIAQFPG